MAKFRAGKAGKVDVNATAMTSTRWTTTLDADALETTNFEGNGKYSGLVGIESLSWEIGTLWDAGQNPLTDPPGLFMRDDGTNMKLYTNVTDNKYWNMPTWLCNNARMENTVRGLVMFTATGKAQDDFTLDQIKGSV